MEKNVLADEARNSTF